MNFTSVLLNVVVPLQFSPPVVNMAKLMTFYTILDSASIIQDKTKALASFQAKGCIEVTGKDDSYYLAFKETTWSYSKFVYHSTCLCETVPLHSQPIQICCPRMKICKRNYNMYIRYHLRIF